MCILLQKNNKNQINNVNKKKFNAFKINTKNIFKLRKEVNEHQTTNVYINGKNVSIDIAIALAIKKLNQSNAKTEHCCQGGDKLHQAYISLKSGIFPNELISAWKNAGFYVSIHIVRATYSFIKNTNIVEEQAGILFQNSLNDWVSNKLDVSGEKYKFQN